VALEMVAAQGGIFGWVTDSAELLQAMSTTRPPVLAAVTEGA
jgi:hypothetical protein